MWCIQKPGDFNKIFPKGCFGSYQKDDVNISKVFSLACTKECFLITNILSNKQNNMNQKFEYARLCIEKSDQLDFEDAINDFNTYQGVFSVLSFEFRRAMMNHRSTTFVNNKLGDSFLFDSMIHILIIQLVKNTEFRFALAVPETRKQIFDSLMDQILERSVEEYTSLQDPSIWLGDIAHLTFKFNKAANHGEKFVSTKQEYEHKIDLKQHLNHLENLPEPLKSFGYKEMVGFNSNILLYGDKGTGKSGILNYIAAWGWQNNWILLKIPSAHRLTQEKIDFERHEETRLFLQNTLAKEVLDDLLITNKHLLEKIQFNSDLYGYIGISGTHDEEPPAVPNTFNEWTQAKLYDSDKFLYEGELQAYFNAQREWKISLKEKLPNPKNLIELIAFAEKEPLYTTAILAEVIEQLQNQETYPVLSLVDDFNYFFRRSVYPSFRYDTRELKSRIPPYHLSLCRLFLRMDGHKFKNGFKVVASSHSHLYKHIFTPEKINYPEGFSWKVGGLRLDEFRMAIFQYVNTNLLKENVVNENLIQQYFVESQGNWGILHFFLRDREMCYDVSTYKLDKKKARSEMLI